jgi:hypothetical protein
MLPKGRLDFLPLFVDAFHEVQAVVTIADKILDVDISPPTSVQVAPTAPLMVPAVLQGNAFIKMIKPHYRNFCAWGDSCESSRKFSMLASLRQSVITGAEAVLQERSRPASFSAARPPAKLGH